MLSKRYESTEVDRRTQLELKNRVQHIFQGCLLVTLTFHLRPEINSRLFPFKTYPPAKFEKYRMINNREIDE